MKKTIKFLALVTLAVLTIVSCKKDDAKIPASSKTTYVGNLAFTPASGTIVANPAGTATISGSRGNYTVTFSNGVPPLTGLKFDVVSNNKYATVSGGTTSGVTIDGNNFNIGTVTSEGIWAFSGTKK